MRQYVGIVLMKRDGSVLVQHRDNIPTIQNPDMWGVIGGAREVHGAVTDKDVKTAGMRELFEETGYQARIEDLRFLTRNHFINANGSPREGVILWAIYDERQPIQCFEGQEICFKRSSELAGLHFAPNHEGYVKKAMQKLFIEDMEKKR